MLNNDAVCFKGFGVEKGSEVVSRFIDDKNIQTNIFRRSAYDSMICGYFYTGFFGYMFANMTG